ncbi:MAG TPA: carboxypeptidase-like regulatory domain-containing protein, partial [Thermoanaerobaculia bacterium]|nr:carboxypeptidase-like regulatory domain-containing protein [Thermoanaerobaculia bacterium]
AEDPGAFVRTDGTGTYSIALTGQTTLRAAAAGYQSAVEAVSAGGRQGPTFTLVPALGVAGTVVDAAGRPIAGALVTAEPDPKQRVLGASAARTRSRSDGRFTLRHLTPGFDFLLRATHPGFVPAELKLPAPPSQASGTPRSPLRLVLEPGRTARGQVVDADGRPVAGAEVALLPAFDVTSISRATDPLAALREAPRGTAGPDGRFSLGGLAPGRFGLRVRAPGFASAARPGIEIPAGNGEVDLGRIALSTGTTLVGTVADPSGKPLAGVEVSVIPEVDIEMLSLVLDASVGARPQSAITGTDGRFRLPHLAAPARVNLAVAREGYVPRLFESQRVPAPEPLTLTLSPAGRLAGRVVDEAGAPVPGAVLRLEEEDRPMTVGRDSFFFTRGASEVVADEEGRFTFADVPAGRPVVRASADGHLPGSLGPLAVAGGGSVSGLRIVLPHGATVTGRVVTPDRAGVAGASVRVLTPPLGAGTFDAMPGAQTDGTGNYLLEGVATGPLSIVAEKEGFARAVRDLDVRQGSNRLDLELGEGFEIGGRVIGDDGAPLAGARLQLTHRAEGLREAASGEGGAFRFTGVSGGIYQLKAEKEGWASAAATEVRIAGAPVRDLEVRLIRGGAVTGRLLGLPPGDLAGVWVFASSAGGKGQQGRVDHGEYRISDLAPGDWSLSAGAGSRRVMAQVTLPEAGASVRRDLQFQGGFTLSGRVLRGGVPVPGVEVFTSGLDTAEVAGSVTVSDAKGAFRLEGLQPGTYDVAVLPQRLPQPRRVQIRGDQEIEIDLPASQVSGRVTDAASSAPLDDAALSLVSKGGQDFPLGDQRSVPDGTFRFEGVAAGSYRIAAGKDGYAPGLLEIEVPESGLSGVDLRLDTAAGLELSVLDPTGGPPSQVEAALLDAAGQVVTSGTYPVGEGGRVRLSQAPAGSFLLLVSSAAGGTVGLPVGVPGPPVRVALPDRTSLTVTPPKSGNARLQILDAAGQPFRSLHFRSVQQEWFLGVAPLVVDDLPPGRWQLVITAQSRVLHVPAETAPGNPARIVLP